MNLKKEHYVFIAIGSLAAALFIISVCRDLYLTIEAHKVYDRAERAKQNADAAVRRSQRTQVTFERLQELEKIHAARGLSASEKEEARLLIDYVQNRSRETGYVAGERFFVQLRKEWGLDGMTRSTEPAAVRLPK